MGDPGQVPGGAEGSESQIAPRHDGTAHDTMLEENTLLRNTQHTSTFESATAPIDGDVSVDTLPNPLPQSIEIMQLLNELHTGIQSANRTALSADPYLAELLLSSGTSFENAIAIIGAVRDDDDARRLLLSNISSPSCQAVAIATPCCEHKRILAVRRSLAAALGTPTCYDRRPPLPFGTWSRVCQFTPKPTSPSGQRFTSFRQAVAIATVCCQQRRIHADRCSCTIQHLEPCQGAQLVAARG